LKIPDKRYENLHHFENRGGHFENGRNLNGRAVQGNPDLKHLQLPEQLILHPHLSSS
jgi:hypothetical protein